MDGLFGKQGPRAIAVGVAIFMVVVLWSTWETVGALILAVDLAPGGEEIKLNEDASLTYPPQPIRFDAASSGADSSKKSKTLTISHPVADKDNRMLIVGAIGEDDKVDDCILNTVKYNAVDLTQADFTITGSANFVCVDLWYLIAPPVGTFDVVMTWKKDVKDRIGGVISIYNAEQQAPEATATQASDSADPFTTNVTTATDDAWIVDVIGSGAVGGFATGEAGQTERTDAATGLAAGAVSSRLVPTAGSTPMTWSQTSGAKAHVLAAFAQDDP